LAAANPYHQRLSPAKHIRAIHLLKHLKILFARRWRKCLPYFESPCHSIKGQAQLVGTQNDIKKTSIHPAPISPLPPIVIMNRGKKARQRLMGLYWNP
jgi:hypothetical protein